MALMMQQVLIGIDTMEMIDEINWFGPSEVDLGFEELDDEALNDEVDDDGDGDGDGDGDDEDDDDEDDADDDYDAVSLIL